jgi:2-polyprenyl-6-hydroxyphenyl methylase/3-demethylubiquinone-9 3-methyltransferase
MASRAAGRRAIVPVPVALCRHPQPTSTGAMRKDLRQVEAHFAFGENWQSFASTVSAAHIAAAEEGLARLFPNGELTGASFFDIGCGSGLSMLAAKALGAAAVGGIDIDPQSVRASQTVLSKHLPGGGWATRVGSVFDLDPGQDGPHDIVHSWGVLHHTGDMWAGVGKAAALVAPGGHFALALYRRTPLCGLWALEKRLYAGAGPAVRAAIRISYKTCYMAGLLATGRNPAGYIANYKSARGMDWHHDVHDWLGGYPYQSTTPQEVRRFLQDRGFSLVREFEKPAALGGLLGTHCDEFVAVRR